MFQSGKLLLAMVRGLMIHPMLEQHTGLGLLRPTDKTETLLDDDVSRPDDPWGQVKTKARCSDPHRPRRNNGVEEVWRTQIVWRWQEDEH